MSSLLEKGRSGFPVTAIELGIWSQKLDQAKRAAGRDKPCVVTSLIVKLMLFYYTALKSFDWREVQCLKTFWELFLILVIKKSDVDALSLSGNIVCAIFLSHR